MHLLHYCTRLLALVLSQYCHTHATWVDNHAALRPATVLLQVGDLCALLAWRQPAVRRHVRSIIATNR
jgi:hypothetical protein